jgi:hypothetical protein
MSQSAVSPVRLLLSHAAPTKLVYCLGFVLASSVWSSSTVLAQQVTPQQKSQAQQTAAQLTQAAVTPGHIGIALADLAPDAPSRYTVKAGDTLWSLANLFLRSPWRWPELWGMNKAQLRNPHRIFPGQVLVLDTSDGKARLGYEGGIPTVKVSPRIRTEALSESAIPPIPMHIINPFLVEAMIVDEKAFAVAPRIVAAQEGRVLLSKGDRAYARSLYGVQGEGGLTMNKGDPVQFRVFRSAKPLKDPTTKEVLGFEAQYIGRALLIRPETIQEVEYDEKQHGFWSFVNRFGWNDLHPRPYEVQSGNAARPTDPSRERVQGGDTGVLSGQTHVTLSEHASVRTSEDQKVYIELQPATIDITATKEEIRPGDRLVPEPEHSFEPFVPRAPETAQTGQIVSIHGNAVAIAGQNQVVVINRGQSDGLATGHVLQIWKDGIVAQDKTDPDRPFVRLPKERNGLMMVFRTFDKLSYALVLQITDAVKIGDRFTNP